jgi:hypothetical protein
MQRLIDANRLLSEDMKKYYYHLPNGDIAIPIIDIEHAPTVDAVPVKHGHWEEPEPDDVYTWDKRAYAQCSVCKKKSYLGRADKYCRYCGAKMYLEG